MYKLDLEKTEEWEIKLPTSIGSTKKQQSSRKISTSALMTMPKLLTVWTTITYGKFFKRWEYQTTWPASWKICILVRKQQLKSDMEQQAGSKFGKEYIKTVYCHPAHLTYMQSDGGLVTKSGLTLATPWTVAHQAPLSMGFPRQNTGMVCHFFLQGYMQSKSCKMLGWMKHKLESRLPGEISIISNRQMIHPNGRKQRGTKKPRDDCERDGNTRLLDLPLEKPVCRSGSNS